MASDPSDWDPLPEMGAAQHPGEQAVNPRLPVTAAKAAVTNSVDADEPMRLPAAVVDEPARAEPVLGAPSALLPVGLRAPTTIASLMQKGGQRQRRSEPNDRDLNEANGNANQNVLPLPAPAPRATVRAPAKTPARPAAPAADKVAATAVPAAMPVQLPEIAAPDGREREPWFRALPAAEQVRLRAAWQREQRAAEKAADPQQKRQELLEWFWVAYVVFFLAALPLMLVEGLAGFVRMAMAGCVTGMVWQMVPRTKLWCVVSAVGVYLAIAVVPRVAELSQSLFDTMVALGGAVITGYLASLAMNEELHRPFAKSHAPAQ